MECIPNISQYLLKSIKIYLQFHKDLRADYLQMRCTRYTVKFFFFIIILALFFNFEQS